MSVRLPRLLSDCHIFQVRNGVVNVQSKIRPVITGGGRGIGRDIALAFAEAGYDVGINDLSLDADAVETLRLIREQGREADFFAADISDSAQVESMFAAFLERFGRIDILVDDSMQECESRNPHVDHTVGIGFCVGICI